VRKFFAAIITSVLVITPYSAEASVKTISLAKFGSSSISTVIKLPAKNECLDIPFKYNISTNYSYPYAFVSFSIENRSQDMLGHTIVRVGAEYDEDGNESPVPHKGEDSIKVCREDWDDFDEDGNGDSFLGVKKGTYYFGFSVVQIRPFKTSSSKTIAITFK
jgi:hypothetical protein